MVKEWKEGRKDSTLTQTRMYKTFIKQKDFDNKRKMFSGKGKFQIISDPGKRLAIHGGLRKRKFGAKRAGLSGVNPFNTKEYTDPVINNKKAKAHLFPDTFGGQNETNNLSFVSEPTNLSVHKPIENDIWREMKMNFSDLQGKTMPKGADLKRRGSMIVEENYDSNGKSTGRVYFAHIDDGDKGGEKYIKYHFNKID